MANVAESARKAANLRVLQRLDRSILDILGSATHVVVYEFKEAQHEWEKCDTEGSLFVVKCDISSQNSCRFQLIVLNRNSTENMVVPITRSFQMQVREPYLIFRYSKNIHGIWFHNGEERSTVHALLERIVKSQPKDFGTPTAKSGDKEAESSQMQPAAATGSLDAGAAASALLSPLTILSNSSNTSETPAANDTATAATTTTTTTTNASPVSDNTTSTMVLDKKNLQLALMSLIQDERFLDLIHAQYVKVAQARANKKE